MENEFHIYRSKFRVYILITFSIVLAIYVSPLFLLINILPGYFIFKNKPILVLDIEGIKSSLSIPQWNSSNHIYWDDIKYGTVVKYTTAFSGWPVEVTSLWLTVKDPNPKIEGESWTTPKPCKGYKKIELDLMWTTVDAEELKKKLSIFLEKKHKTSNN